METDQPGSKPAGWKKDPSGRHFGRYWDGEQWTEHVISAEKVQSIDRLAAWLQPLVLPDSPPPPPPRTAAATPPAPPPGREPSKVLVPAPSIETATPTAGGVLESFLGSPRSARWTLAVVTLLLVISAATAGNDDKTTVDAGQDEAATTQVTPAATAPPAAVKPSRESQLAAFAQSFESIRVVLADAIKRENPVSVASVNRFEFDLEGPTVILNVTSAHSTSQQDAAWDVTNTMQQLWEERTIANVPDVIPHFRLTVGAVRYECLHDFMMRLASLRASREDWEATCRLA